MSLGTATSAGPTGCLTTSRGLMLRGGGGGGGRFERCETKRPKRHLKKDAGEAPRQQQVQLIPHEPPHSSADTERHKPPETRGKKQQGGENDWKETLRVIQQPPPRVGTRV